MFNRKKIFVLKQLLRHSELNIASETKREENILKKCNSMNTFISILLVPLISTIFELYDRVKYSKLIIIIMGIYLITTLLISLYYSIKAQYINKKNFLSTNKDFYNHIEKYKITKEIYFLEQEIKDNDDIYNSIKINNNNKIDNLKKSFQCLSMFFVSLVIFAIIFIVSEMRCLIWKII